MSANSAIEWTDNTWNPWWGCDEVSPACDHCYARVLAKRFGLEWGAHAPRRFFGEKHWQDPVRWNRAAAKAGERKRVFCASMGDVFEILPGDHPQDGEMEAARQRLWKLIESTPRLDWQLLTKRPKNILGLVPKWWRDEGFPANVWVGVTAENQEWFQKRSMALRNIPAAVLFLSCEPMLGPISLSWTMKDGTQHPAPPWLNWVIVGGESGHAARPFDLEHARALIRQCRDAGVPCFVKQLGKWVRGDHAGFALPDRYLLDDLTTVYVPPMLMSRQQRPLNAAAFSLGPKGGDMRQWPADLRVREFPAVTP